MQVGLSLIATCIVLKCYFSNPTFSEVPMWIRVLVIQGIGQLLKIEIKRERRKAIKKQEEKKSKRRKSMADALDPNINLYLQSHSSRRNSEANAKTKRPVSMAEPLDPNFNLHNQNLSFGRNSELNGKPKRPVSVADPLDPNVLSSRRNTEKTTKSKRPVSIAESVDPNFNLYHQNYSSRRNTEANINLLEVPACGACHQLTVDMLHLGPGLNSKNLYRSSSRRSLRRESWCENPLEEKAELNTNVQSQSSLLSALLHRQEHLVNYVKELVQAVDEQEEHDSKREEWILVAEILDTFFLYAFVVVMIGSTLLIFTAGTSW